MTETERINLAKEIAEDPNAPMYQRVDCLAMLDRYAAAQRRKDERAINRARDLDAPWRDASYCW